METEATRQSEQLPRNIYRAGTINFVPFLRATAVPAGTAVARISYGDSVCLSFRHDPVSNQAQVR